MPVSPQIFKKLSLIYILSVTFFAHGIGTAAPTMSQAWDHNHPRVRELIAVHDKIKQKIMEMDDVIGTSVSKDEQGEAGIVVYVNQEGKNPAHAASHMPKKLGGENVSVIMTPPFHAFATASTSHTTKQTVPIALGTSGGWIYDSAHGYCCGGTLGALVQIGSYQYLLSNYHVLEADILPGGNNKTSRTGDAVIQPGLVDVLCNYKNAQSVGRLIKLSSLPSYNVDVSIAQVNTGMVQNDGSILEIGPISKSTSTAAINNAVKKSGRTTGLTKSKIVGLNATVKVTYENECAGSIAFTKTFTGQIIVDNPANQFLNAGDSGSLLVEDVDTTPKPIGLLFAGSTTLAVANPITDVLSFISKKMGKTATIVGQ